MRVLQHGIRAWGVPVEVQTPPCLADLHPLIAWDGGQYSRWAGWFRFLLLLLLVRLRPRLLCVLFICRRWSPSALPV